MAKRRYLYLMIEEQARELRARLLLARHALARGFTVLVGQQWLLSENFDRLPPGVVVVKGNNDAQVGMMQRARRAGHRVASIEEEALGIADLRLILRLYSASVPEFCDLVLAQGDSQRDALAHRFPAMRERIRVVGNARADLLDRRYLRDVAARAAQLQRCHGPYVLINTNYSTINSHHGDTLYYYAVAVNVGVIDRNSEPDLEELRTWSRWQRADLHAVCATIRALLDRKVAARLIVRPHPAEALGPWERALAGMEGVSLIREGDHLAWTLGSEIMLHTSCTTGLEALLLDHPALNLTPGEHPWRERYLVNLCTPQVATAEAAAGAIARFLAGDRSMISDRAAGLRRLRPHLLLTEGGAAARSVAALAAIAPSVDAGIRAKPLRRTVPLQRHVEKAFVDPADLRERFATIAEASGWTAPTAIEEVGPALFRLETRP